MAFENYTRRLTAAILDLVQPEVETFGAPKSCIVNRQIGIGNSEYVVISDTLPRGHVTQRMRNMVFGL